jgi:hypothetical protein
MPSCHFQRLTQNVSSAGQIGVVEVPPYVSNVIAAVAWLSCRCTTLIFAPLEINRDTHVPEIVRRDGGEL